MTRTEQELRDELSLIGDRRDLIAHAVDIAPGTTVRNLVSREDAAQVIEFIQDLVAGIDDEMEARLS